jgi:hypothetical protein
VYDIYKGEPDTYLDELQWWLAVNHDIAISLSALQKNLQDAGLTRKLLRKIAKERDEVNRELLGDSDLLVFVDETSKNEQTLAWRFGRALAGERAAFADVFVCGQRYSLAAAMSKHSYIATKVVPGSFDSFDFFDFISENVVSLVIWFNSIFTNNF